jgi:outer membrane protein assembly factor BamD
VLRAIAPIAFLVAVLCLLSGCGAIDYFFLQQPADTPRELMEAGNQAMRDKDYGDAIEHFTKLKERYPFSPYTPDAELGLADAYYLDGKYQAAESAYKEFESLHPGSEEIPYVLYQIGLSNFQQFKSIDLPQDNITEALQYFKRVTDSHPDSEHASKAKEYIDKCRRFQAKHELFVADFYWRTEQYKAAWMRYRYVREHFPELDDIFEYADERSRAAYYKYCQRMARQELRAQEGSWKDWFEWL